MVEVGLKPYCVTNNAIMTGYKCSHDIVPDGPFETVAKKFIELRGELPIATVPTLNVRLINTKHRPLMVCPSCHRKMSIPKGLNISIMCNDCNVEMIGKDGKILHHGKVTVK